MQAILNLSPPRPPRDYGPEIIRDEQGGTFRVLVGVHYDFGPPGCQCDRCYQWDRGRRKQVMAQGKPDPGPNPNHAYESYDDYTHGPGRIGGYLARCHRQRIEPLPRDQYTNDIIVSKQDLCARLNANIPGGIKFERIDAMIAPPAPAEPAGFPLERMTVAQLLAVAADEGIDVKGATKRPELVEAITAARARA